MTTLPTHRGLWLTSLLAVIGFVAGAQGQTIFTEGTFAPAGWQSYYNAGLAGTGSANQVTGGGGNPGDFLKVIQTSDNNYIDTFVIFSSGVYNPATSGAIGSLSGSFDAIDLVDSQGFAFAIRQTNINYYATPNYSSAASWTTLSWSALTGTSFGVVGNASAHPDFSAAGGPIKFGILTLNDGGSGTRTTQTGYDNFSVTVTAVPEPATYAFLAGLSALGLALRRRRRAKA